MRVKISHELRMKILEVDEIEYDERGRPGIYIRRSIIDENVWDICFNLNLVEHDRLLDECRKWIHHIQAYFKTSYTAIKADIGPFNRAWPNYIEDSIVHFKADNYDPNQESWKDWFIVEDIKDAPQFIQETK